MEFTESYSKLFYRKGKYPEALKTRSCFKSGFIISKYLYDAERKPMLRHYEFLISYSKKGNLRLVLYVRLIKSLFLSE